MKINTSMLRSSQSETMPKRNDCVPKVTMLLDLWQGAFLTKEEWKSYQNAFLQFHFSVQWGICKATGVFEKQYLNGQDANIASIFSDDLFFRWKWRFYLHKEIGM